MENRLGAWGHHRMDRVFEIDEEGSKLGRNRNLAGLTEERDAGGVRTERLQCCDRIVDRRSITVLPVEHCKRDRRGHEGEQVERVGSSNCEVQGGPGRWAKSIEEQLPGIWLQH